MYFFKKLHIFISAIKVFLSFSLLKGVGSSQVFLGSSLVNITPPVYLLCRIRLIIFSGTQPPFVN